jgi:hypothetical protein
MNSKRGAVPFEANGQAYTLRLTTNAMVRYEDAAGHPVLEALGKMEDGAMSMVALRRLFAAMISPEVSEDDAGDIMDELGLAVAAQKIGEAATLAFPQSSAAGNAKKPPRKT